MAASHAAAGPLSPTLPPRDGWRESTGGSATPMRAGSGYCHRKRRSARAKVTTVHATRMTTSPA